MRVLKGWRTVIFNVVMGGVLFWNQVIPDQQISPDEVTGAWNHLEAALISVYAIGNLVLRAVTDTRIGER